MPPKKKGKEDDGKDAKGAKDAPRKASTAPSASTHFMLLQQCVPGTNLTTEDSECSLVYVPDDADPRRPPSPKHRTQHSKYELNDMRRRCEEL